MSEYILIGLGSASLIGIFVTLWITYRHNKRSYALQQPAITVYIGHKRIVHETGGDYSIVLFVTIYSRHPMTISATLLINTSFLCAKFKEPDKLHMPGEQYLQLKEGEQLHQALCFSYKSYLDGQPMGKTIYLDCYDPSQNRVFDKQLKLPKKVTNATP